MITDPQVRAAFVDELEKIAASRQMWRFGKTRSGRRPLSIAKMLKLDAAGKLFKRASFAGDLVRAFGMNTEKSDRRARKGSGPPVDDSKLDEGRDTTGLVSGLGGPGEWATPTGKVI